MQHLLKTGTPVYLLEETMKQSINRVRSLSH